MIVNHPSVMTSSGLANSLSFPGFSVSAQHPQANGLGVLFYGCPAGHPGIMPSGRICAGASVFLDIHVINRKRFRCSVVRVFLDQRQRLENGEFRSLTVFRMPQKFLWAGEGVVIT